MKNGILIAVLLLALTPMVFDVYALTTVYPLTM